MITSDDEIDAGERMRPYAGISAVAHDFGIDSEAYRAADIWFSQNPRPHQVMLGRWVKEPAPASLLCAILTAAQQAMTSWRAITDGSFAIAVGGTSQNVGPLDFSLETNLNGVASVINAAMTGATARWTAQGRFIFRTTATGVAATIGILEPVSPATGTDISAMLKGDEDNYDRIVPGQAAETALGALAQIDALFSSNFYGVVCPEGDDDDQLDMAAYCEASDPVHYLGVTTQDTNTLDPMHTSDLGSVLHDFGYTKTAAQYSTYSKYAVLSYLARILTTDWTGSNTTITQKFKRQPGIHIEQLSMYQADALDGKRVNVYTGIANGANIVQEGWSSSGDWTDLIIGADALALEVQNRIFAALYNNATKLPQDDAGLQILLNNCAGACTRFRTNGFLAPGVWFAPGFGNLDYGRTLDVGYYVYAPSMGDQPEEERMTRCAPLIQIAAKTAGAIHRADIQIFINQ